jgi:methionyl-tRNA formyltransferase
MRVVFMGTPEFALPSLRTLFQNNYDIVSVVTVPDKPAGRGLKELPSSVKKFAVENNLPVIQPITLKDKGFITDLEKLNADLFVIVAFRILPPEVYLIPRFGSFNLHASLLPRYRGAAPINWAIIRGERETGVTTFFLSEKVDTGDIILQSRVSIGSDETAGELHDRLATVGAEIVLQTVQLISAGSVKTYKQDKEKSSLAPKIFKNDCLIPWSKSSFEVHNIVRGLSPKPTAYTHHGSALLKIYRTRISSTAGHTESGTVLEADERLRIATGDGSIEILEIQQEGKKRMTTEEFLRGYKLRTGEKLS